jgi:hypothetical protein
MTPTPPAPPRRRLLVDAVGIAVAVACYLLLATRGAAIGWVVP